MPDFCSLYGKLDARNNEYNIIQNNKSSGLSIQQNRTLRKAFFSSSTLSAFLASKFLMLRIETHTHPLSCSNSEFKRITKILKKKREAALLTTLSIFYTFTDRYDE